MAPLPGSNSARWYLDYTVAGEDHTLLMRSIDEVDAAQASTAIDAFLTAVESQFYEMSVNGFRHSAKGSDVSLPATWGGASTYGTDDGPHDHSAAYLHFVGRTENGRRAGVSVFGGKNFSLGADFRVSEADSSVVTDGIAALVADTECWLGIDEFSPTWNRYFNIGTNAYWRNKIR